MAKLTYQSNKVKYEISQEEKKIRVTFSDGTFKEYTKVRATEPMTETSEVKRVVQISQ